MATIHKTKWGDLIVIVCYNIIAILWHEFDLHYHLKTKSLEDVAILEEMLEQD